MAKSRTRVILPGGIQGLVHDLQNGGSQKAQNPVEGNNENVKNNSEAQNAQNVDNQQNNQNNATARNNAPLQTNAPQQPVDNQQGKVVEENVVVAEPNVAENRAQSGNPTTPSENAASQTPSGPGRRPKQNTMKEYHIVKDDSKDSWQLFLDMAKQYKEGGGKLATIYIDGTLKNVLDRMKYAGPEKLSTSAILSSIVARFIYDHEDDIRKVLFSGELI